MFPGVGWSEFMLFALVAIIVIGPKDLPRVMRAFGKFVGKARAMARDFQDSFEEIAREAEMEDLRIEAEKMRAELSSTLTSGPAIPLTPEEEDRLIATHNAKVLETSTPSTPAPEATPELAVAAAATTTTTANADPPPDNVTPIRGVRR